MPTLTDDDLASATNEDLMRLALLVAANAALDLADHIIAHGGPPCTVKHAHIIAGMASIAAKGQITQEHIDRFKNLLADREIGEPAGHG